MRRATALDARRHSRGSHAEPPSVSRRRADRAELEPMTPVERKIVHEALKDDPGVETASEGSEPNRFVVVLPRLIAD